MPRQIPPGRAFSYAAPTLAPNLAALGVTCNPQVEAASGAMAVRKDGRPTIKAYKGMRARLNMISAVNVPTKAGSGRMNTMRTPHRNCTLKQRDPCEAWPHSNDTTIQTTSRKCGDSSNTPIIRLPALIFLQDRYAA